jgi:hypothetical protein
MKLFFECAPAHMIFYIQLLFVFQQNLLIQGISNPTWQAQTLPKKAPLDLDANDIVCLDIAAGRQLYINNPTLQ